MLNLHRKFVLFSTIMCFLISIQLVAEIKSPYIDFTFAGDIMAHSENFKMENYTLIYEDIENILSTDDLSFANLETPVDESIPYKTYPEFNIHQEYVEAAINAGFDVFSLANNHTNDQGLKGMLETYNYFEVLKQRDIYSSGLNSSEKESNTYTYSLIKKKGWTILFLAVTEIVNRFTYLNYMNYLKPENNNRLIFMNFITKIRKENPCDICILSVHCYEPEYIRDVSEKRRKFYYNLLDAGVDIIWANHPHVTQEYEIIVNKESQKNEKLILYSLGNTISGQRRKINYLNPNASREYTGDSILMQVSISKHGKRLEIDYLEPIFITTHIDENKRFLIKRMNENFINNQEEKVSKYYTERLKLMQTITGKTTCR